MHKNIAKKIKECSVCQKTKHVTSEIKGLLYPRQVPRDCWEVITMGFITPLPKTAKSYDGILEIVDNIFKYAIFCKCESTIDANKTAKLFIKHVFIHFGVPKTIIGDRGTRFVSSFLSRLFELLEVKLKKNNEEQYLSSAVLWAD